MINPRLRSPKIIKNIAEQNCCFLLIVVGATIFFWFFEGIEGAMVGFGNGIVGGLFLIHESLAVNKNTITCLRGIPQQRVPKSEKKE